MRRWAATLLCGLLLLNLPAESWAGQKKSTSKKAEQTQPESEIGLADIDDKELLGLRGHASFYGVGFQGRKTATGEIFDVRSFTAASNRFPLGTKVAVRRIDNDRCAIVKVNDRMHGKHRRRIIDVSRGAAEYLGMIQAGVVLVRVAPLQDDASSRDASNCHAAFDPDISCDHCGPPTLDP